MKNLLIQPSDRAGVNKSDDGERVVLFLKNAAGEELLITITKENHWQVCAAIIDAVSAFPEEVSYQGQVLRRVLSTNWVEVGAVPQSGDVVISFELSEGARLSFEMNRATATILQQALAVGLGLAQSNDPTRTPQRH